MISSILTTKFAPIRKIEIEKFTPKLEPAIACEELSQDSEPAPLEVVSIRNQLLEASVLGKHLEKRVCTLARDVAVRKVQVL